MWIAVQAVDLAEGVVQGGVERAGGNERAARTGIGSASCSFAATATALTEEPRSSDMPEVDGMAEFVEVRRRSPDTLDASAFIAASVWS